MPGGLAVPSLDVLKKTLLAYKGKYQARPASRVQKDELPSLLSMKNSLRTYEAQVERLSSVYFVCVCVCV